MKTVTIFKHSTYGRLFFRHLNVILFGYIAGLCILLSGCATQQVIEFPAIPPAYQSTEFKIPDGIDKPTVHYWQVRSAEATTDNREYLKNSLLTTARGFVYRQESVLRSRGLVVDDSGSMSVSQTQSDGIGGNSPQKPSLGYQFVVDQVRMEEDPSGNKLGGIDAHLDIVDEEGKVLQRFLYYNPSLVDRQKFKSDYSTYQTALLLRGLSQNTQKKSAKAGTISIDLQDVLKSTSQNMLNAVAESRKNGGSTSFEMLLRDSQGSSRLNHYAGLVLMSENPGNRVARYQKEDELIRQAAEALMQHASTSPHRINVPPLRNKSSLNKGNVLFSSGELDMAIQSWESSKENPARNYNLGVGYLKRAAQKWGKGTEKGQSSGQQMVAEAYRDLVLSEKMFVSAADSDSIATMQTVKSLKKRIAALNPKIADPLIDTASVSTTPPDSDKQPTVSPSVPSVNLSSQEKFALIIGIGSFQDSTIPALPAAPKDAKLMTDTLRNCGFKEENITTLVDQDATLMRIKESMETIARKAKPEDLVVVTVATHGSSPDEKFDSAKEGYIVCYDSNVNNLFASAYPMADFRFHLDRRLKCSRRVVFQDTCHSGAVGDTRFGYSLNTIAFDKWPPNFAYFAAASKEQASLETKGNGIFTKTVADYLRKSSGRTTISELADFVKKQVPINVRKSCPGQEQTPQVFLGEGAGEYRLN